MKIVITTERISIQGQLNNTKTAQEIIKKLPIKSNVQTWGNEIYFSIPVHCKAENSTMKLKIGDIAYWPAGHCFCIFFGKTPASVDDNPRPASEVNLIGEVIGDINILKTIGDGEPITIRQGD